eukprot:Gregarina_sp_Poly_1__10693@NODE_80_length_15637_cov_125_963134_g68_i0_p15_GENE_NODE_80_length_15637_cov_125_963134_g68_i0NODE_80_length_15637_cov_125_963134_g68_i0_p15_ORF_typecomplete_len108_score19_15_NODE_80_length_15637_cov_125_963134_g68_i0114437
MIEESYRIHGAIQGREEDQSWISQKIRRATGVSELSPRLTVTTDSEGLTLNEKSMTQVNHVDVDGCPNPKELEAPIVGPCLPTRDSLKSKDLLKRDTNERMPLHEPM